MVRRMEVLFIPNFRYAQDDFGSTLDKLQPHVLIANLNPQIASGIRHLPEVKSFFVGGICVAHKHISHVEEFRKQRKHYKRQISHGSSTLLKRAINGCVAWRMVKERCLFIHQASFSSSTQTCTVYDNREGNESKKIMPQFFLDVMCEK